jgi:hypothetical protein
VFAFVLRELRVRNTGKESERYLAIPGAQASARIKAQPPHAATDQSDGGGQSGNVISHEISEEHSAIQFATVQLFVAVYLQKFAVGPLSFQISLPILIMLGHIGFMLITGRMQFAPLRLGCYLMFASSCFLSQAISGTRFSIPSTVELLLIYGFLTVTSFVSESAYQLVLKRFIGLMIIPAVIVFVQYFYQKITGLSDPISVNRMFPKSVLLQGYFYDAHYPWNSTFQRPNGFFFLEPSVVSMFTASAAIIELTYFKRIRHALLMIGATAFSMGGTGLTMLLIASPFLLARQTLPVVLLVGVAALMAFSAAIALNVPLPLLSRVDELHQATSSGSGRILIPAEQFIKLLLDPSHFLTGTGAGSTTAALGNAWPVLKLINEYGLLTTILYVTLYLMAIARSYNAQLAIAISLVFHFTGGYLLDAVVVQFMAVIFCMVVPLSRVGRGPPHAAYGGAARSELCLHRCTDADDQYAADKAGGRSEG